MAGFSDIFCLLFIYLHSILFSQMVSVRNISVSFGSFDLLSDISFLINNQDRIG